MSDNTGQVLALLGLGQHAVKEKTVRVEMACGDFSLIQGDGSVDDSNGETVDSGYIAVDDGNKSILLGSKDDYDQLLSLLIAGREKAHAYFDNP